MWRALPLLCLIPVYCNILAPADEFCDSACGIIALVPARGGSKGLIDKNIAKLGNETLIARTISIILSSQAFASVWVSTDSEKIAHEAEAAGARVHWRAPETATDNATTLSVVQDFIKTHGEVAIVAVIQCTSPFLCPNWLNKAALVMSDKDVDCVFAVTRSYKLRWEVSSDYYAIPTNFNPSKRPRRQDWIGELYETGMFYFVRRAVVEVGLLQNNRCKTFEVPPIRSLEIDTSMNLAVATAMLNILAPC